MHRLGAEDLQGELVSTVRRHRPRRDNAAAAVAVWLATNPSQADNGGHVLREGTRLVFEGNPPAPLAKWLAARGIEL